MIYLKDKSDIETAAFHFISIKNVSQLARLLSINPSEMYDLAGVPKYREFNIPKKKGGYRKITAPAENLQQLQKRLNFYLQSVYCRIMPDCVHGFIKADGKQSIPRGIVSNANVHANRKYILNLDLKDFFPGISASRVRKMFMAVFDFDIELATCLTLLTTYNKSLPVGSPTSPAISNYVALSLDLKLDALAKSNIIRYSRYADDMTFSSDIRIEKKIFDEIKYFINDAGFEINENKTRQLSFKGRQIVTGITVNMKPNVNRRYIRNIRAILDHWFRHGVDAAWQRYFSNPVSYQIPGPDTFIQAIRGKIEHIGMVRGKDDDVYKNLKQNFLMIYYNENNCERLC